MQPVYKPVDSFPYQRGQVPYGHHGYPSFEAIRPQMKVDAPISPITYETWPHGCNCCQPFPVGCHSCCGHSYIPGYYSFKPPYAYYPPPSPFYFHGGYPSFPESDPVHHVPPLHYSIEKPRYEYDKNAPGDYHCCGCPNHPCNSKEDRHLRIEEQEPDSEKKSNEEKKDSNYLVPVEWGNNPYPILWVPPAYMDNREQRNPTESVGDTVGHKILKPSGEDSNAWGGWLPFDISNLGYEKHDGDKKRAQKESGDNAEADRDQKSIETSLSSLKASADCGSEGSTGHTRASNGRVGSEVASKTTEKKTSRQKTIPRMPEEAEEKNRGNMVKDDRENQAAETGVKRQSSSPPKISKLPPVCLRVDPLPKEKNGNRSPSPPDRNGKSSTDDEVECPIGATNKLKKVEPDIKERKADLVKDGLNKQEKGEEYKVQNQQHSVPISCPEECSRSQNTRKDGSCSEAYNVEEDKVLMANEEKRSEEPIQSKDETDKGQPHSLENKGESNAEKEYIEEVKKSVYRGFLVRRWEPLKKLKEIAKVRTQAADVRSQIEALESSPVSNDNRQRVVTAESIMTLLLKLDTIQGLHPTVRDIRKSVAKELVNLQERLDLLNSEKSEATISKPVGGHPTNTGENVSSLGGEMDAGNTNTDGHDDNKSQSVEEPDLTKEAGAAEDSAKVVVEKDPSDHWEDETMASHLRSSEDICMAEAEPDNGLENGLNNKVFEDVQFVEESPSENMEPKQPVELLPLIPDQRVDATVEKNEQIETGEFEVLESRKVESLEGMDESAETDQEQHPLYALQEEQAIADWKHESRIENKVLLHEEVESKQDEMLTEQQNHIEDKKETSNAEELSLSNSADAWDELEKYTERTERGDNFNELLGKYETQEFLAELPLAQIELHNGETSETEGPHPELELVAIETLNGEASKRGIPQPELSAPNEFLGREACKPTEPLVKLFPPQNEIHGIQEYGNGMGNDEQDRQKEGVVLEGSKGGDTELEVITVEENSDEAIEQLCGSETAEEEAILAEESAPDNVENAHVEDYVLPPVSPPASEVSSISNIVPEIDKKLVEENEKLREMMAKLIEAGQEQLTAISNLSGRVKDLEKKLARKKKLKTKRVRTGPSCG
ncbi:hypothetical protein NMG60_11022788 [Bertholletia excelsa]